ncbi:MAG: zf-HC2 domain-containing protein [Rhizonema sp. PD37]|nr:zf-HC2 domain-containing protein [Rhizonema sp. PD37]
MNTDSQFNKSSYLQLYKNLLERNDKHTNESTGAMRMMKHYGFELLSAYLDGELTVAERRQVEEWLANDPSVQSLYARQIKIRQGLRTLPVPQPQQPVEETVQQVMKRLHRRSITGWMFGGVAIAACVLGAISGLLINGEGRTPQLAYKQTTTEPIKQAQAKSQPATGSPLMVAINNPVVPIPKAAEASRRPPIYQTQPSTGSHME